VRTWIGRGACIEIGDDAVVGIGVVVTSHVAPDETVLGNPAREISEHCRAQAVLRESTNPAG
jgi:acetyltransferase-like isoleucine patch superfamily enzyme